LKEAIVRVIGVAVILGTIVVTVAAVIYEVSHFL
jgi:hypothetical protein